MQFEHAVDVAATPGKTFAFVDDLAQMPRWLSRCTAMEKLTPGANAVGTKLVFRYLQGKRPAEMAGEIATRRPDEHLGLRYHDKLFDVALDFRIEPAAGGARLAQTIALAPRSLAGRLLQPIVRRVVPGMLASDLAKLAALLTE